MFPWPWLCRALGFGSLKQLGCVHPPGRLLWWARGAPGQDALPGSGLSPAFQETLVVVRGLVPNVVVRGLLLAVLPAHSGNVCVLISEEIHNFCYQEVIKHLAAKPQISDNKAISCLL